MQDLKTTLIHLSAMLEQDFSPHNSRIFSDLLLGDENIGNVNLVMRPDKLLKYYNCISSSSNDQTTARKIKIKSEFDVSFSEHVPYINKYINLCCNILYLRVDR